MANESRGFVKRFTAAVFTAVIAPVLVIVLTKRLIPDTAPQAPTGNQAAHGRPGGTGPQGARGFAFAAVGQGRSSDAALQDAYHTSVREAIAALVDTDTLAKKSAAIGAIVDKHSAELVKSYREEASNKKGQTGKEVYQIKIVADIGRQELMQQLKNANVRVKNGE